MKLYSAIYHEFHPLDLFFPDAVRKVVVRPSDLDEPGILILHGGADIHPSLYNKGRSFRSGASYLPSQRDNTEWELLKAAKDKNILTFGICRGAQMLCAAAGGYLYQDVDNHAIGDAHRVHTDDGVFLVNSYHHQMCAPWNVEHKLLGVSEPLTSKVYDVDDIVTPPSEPEAVYYPAIRGFGVQWHPEWMSEKSEASKWIFQQLQTFL